MINISIRKIIPADNAGLASIIRRALEEFKANKPGTVYFDESTDRLSELFTVQGSCYFTALANNTILGGAGIFPTTNLPEGTGELVKMYLSPEARGLGLGKKLMEYCLAEAGTLGYKKVYLETMPELTNAIPMYEKMGFSYLEGPLGNSGHTGCGIWMIKEL
jgi:putative acetyltransferase